MNTTRPPIREKVRPVSMGAVDKTKLVNNTIFYLYYDCHFRPHFTKATFSSRENAIRAFEAEEGEEIFHAND